MVDAVGRGSSARAQRRLNSRLCALPTLFYPPANALVLPNRRDRLLGPVVSGVL